MPVASQPPTFASVALYVAALTLSGLAVIGVLGLVVETFRVEQGPPAWRHYHLRDGFMEECDSRICAPKPEVDL